MSAEVSSGRAVAGLRGTVRAFHLGLAQPPRFLAGQITFVESHLPAMVDGDIDTPALALRGLLVFPAREILARRDDLHPAPPGLDIGGLARIDGGVLRGPERIAVREIAGVAEQVGDDLALVVGEVEQRGGGGNRAAAEQPGLQLRSARRIAVGVVEQRQPGLLLRLAGEGQVADGVVVDLLGAAGLADTRQEIAEREDALHRDSRERESRGDVVHGTAFLHQPSEALPLGDRVGVLPQHVLDHRDFERFGVVPLADDDAWDASNLVARLGRFETGEIAPLARDDLEVTVLAIGPHEQRRDDAAPDDRREDVGYVGRLLPGAHIGFRDRKVVEGDVVDLHGLAPLSGGGPAIWRATPGSCTAQNPHTPRRGGVGGEVRPERRGQRTGAPRRGCNSV